jgi:hypothetical protein
VRSAAEIAILVVAGALPSLAYLAVGLWLLRGLRLRVRGGARIALAYAFGTGAASLVVLVLRMLDIAVPWLALMAVAATGIPAWRMLGNQAGPEPARRGWVRAVDAATLALALLTFFAALGPETFWDGLEYHLPMIQAWSAGPIRALPAMPDAEFRAGVDLLYLPAVALGQPDAAAAVSACFAVALAALIRAEAARRATPGAGALAGFLALVVPLTLRHAPSTYVDLGVGLYGFAALLLADRWNRGDAPGALLGSAVCLAFAVNAKLHAAALAPALLVIVALGGRHPPWRVLVGCAALASALVTPWLVKASLTSGNPLFPFLGDWLGYGPTSAQYLELRRFRLSTDFPAPHSVAGFARYVAAIHFGHNAHVSGLIGPLPLAFAPFALGRLSRPTAALGATLAGLFVMQFVYMPALRFGTPLLPFLAVAAAVGGARLARSAAPLRWVVALSLVALSAHHLAGVAQRYLPRIAALAQPEAYERRVLPDQVALREVVQRAEPVVAIPKGAVFWMDRPVYNLHWERNGELFFDDLFWDRYGKRVIVERTPPERALALLRRRGVRTLALDVAPPHPRDGTVGHPTVDAWLRGGAAALRPDPDPPRARGRRVWVLVDLK